MAVERDSTADKKSAYQVVSVSKWRQRMVWLQTFMSYMIEQGEYGVQIYRHVEVLRVLTDAFKMRVASVNTLSQHC